MFIAMGRGWDRPFRDFTIMRRIFGIVLCHQLAATTLLGATLTIRVDPGVAYQTIDGFGASDAWQCDIVGRNWPEEKRERIAELLFSREADVRSAWPSRTTTGPDSPAATEISSVLTGRSLRLRVVQLVESALR